MLLTMNDSNRPFYKGVQGFTRQFESDLVEAAEDSVYYWWWAFMRLSPVFWYARHAGVAPKNEALARAWANSGDLSNGLFRRWWKATGAHVFAEAKRPASVRVVNMDQLEEHRFYPQGSSLLLEVPLTIRKETILQQVKRLLALEHEGRALNLAATSTAQFALHTKRYRLRTLELEYWVLLYRMLYPNISVLGIGDKLQISPSLRVRGVERKVYSTHVSSPHDKLQSITGRYLYKAQSTLANVERGSFPNASKPLMIEQPFGAKHHADFLAATGRRLDVLSPWHAWLQDQYLDVLRHHIIRKNNLGKAVIGNSRIKAQIPKFLAGETDLTA